MLALNLRGDNARISIESRMDTTIDKKQDRGLTVIKEAKIHGTRICIATGDKALFKGSAIIGINQDGGDQNEEIQVQKNLSRMEVDEILKSNGPKFDDNIRTINS